MNRYCLSVRVAESVQTECSPSQCLSLDLSSFINHTIFVPAHTSTSCAHTASFSKLCNNGFASSFSQIGLIQNAKTQNAERAADLTTVRTGINRHDKLKKIPEQCLKCCHVKMCNWMIPHFSVLCSFHNCCVGWSRGVNNSLPFPVRAN